MSRSISMSALVTFESRFVPSTGRTWISSRSTSQPPAKAKSVTHVSGTICHLCLRSLNQCLTGSTTFPKKYVEAQWKHELRSQISTAPFLFWSAAPKLPPPFDELASLPVFAAKSVNLNAALDEPLMSIGIQSTWQSDGNMVGGRQSVHLQSGKPGHSETAVIRK